MNQKLITRISYLFLVGVLIAVAVLQSATPLLTVLFSYFALNRLNFGNRKGLAVLIFVILVSAIFYGFVFFVRESVKTLPSVAETAIPIVIQKAQQWGIELPFTDVQSLRAATADALREQLQALAKFAEIATKEFVFLIVGLVVAIGIFLNPKLDLKEGQYRISNNAYSALCAAISARFASFYGSFRTVMGAQLVISSINTFFTSIFVAAVSMPFGKMLIVVTFLCGLLPIVGNLISNTIIFAVGLTHSVNMALLALLYLIVLHKFEYFLNSKIIGGRIKNPMWLTLLGLLVGERVMGIPGMILAPVVLDFIKSECSEVTVAATDNR